MWARDRAESVDESLCGTHPLYLEHRLGGEPASHEVLLLNAAGGDILLFTPQDSLLSVLQYQLIGGVLDFHFFSGPNPQDVARQYSDLVGRPPWQPV